MCKWGLDVLVILVPEGENLCGGERGEEFLGLGHADGVQLFQAQVNPSCASE